jgi:quercetin dioxygenase-like cupin family protein
MPVHFQQSFGDEEPIAIPAIGLNLFVRVPDVSTDRALSVIETINAPGFGPPLHRHPQAEIFRVLEGRYLYEVDGKRFHASAGDVVSIPGGAAHAFINVTDKPARQYIIILPSLDAKAFFTGLGDVMRDGRPDTERLNAFAKAWEVEFLGPPLAP